MGISEEKIKEFVSNEDKVKMIMNDEEFVSAVSGGKCTPETYRNEFKKIGLELSGEEANQVSSAVNKVFETPAEKLDDEFLKNVSGGTESTEGDTVFKVGIGLGIGSALAGVGCMIASKVYREKADKALKKMEKKGYGEKELKDINKLVNKIDKLEKAMLGLFGGAVVAVGVGSGVGYKLKKGK